MLVLGRLAFLIQRMKRFPLEIIPTHCEAPLASNSTTKGVFSRNFSLAQYKEIPFFAITKVRKVGVDPCKITPVSSVAQYSEENKTEKSFSRLGCAKYDRIDARGPLKPIYLS